MSTQRYKAPIVRVALADTKRRRYDINAGDEPFFMYDDLPELAKQNKLLCSYFPANTLQQFGSQPVPRVIAINRRYLKGLLLRPFYRQPVLWQRSDGSPTRRWGVYTSTGAGTWGTPPGTIHNDFWDYYTFLPTAGANWDFTLAEDGLLWEMTQKVAYTGTGENLSDWTVSVVGFAGTEDVYGINQGLSPNPFFTAGFRRQAIPPEFLAALSDELEADPDSTAAEYCSTQIVWGVNAEIYPQGKWMLHCPLQGRPVLYERVLAGNPWTEDPSTARWEPRQWTEGDLSEIKPKQAAEDGYTYHIGTMGHAICVSEGGFDGEERFAYYLPGNLSEPVVPYGEMFMRNWPGQCTFWLDLNVFPTGKVQRWPFYVPSFRSADVGSYVWGQPFSSTQQYATDPLDDAVVVSELPGVEGMAAQVLPLGLYEDMTAQALLRYELLLSAGTYPVGADPTAEVVTQTPPFVEAVTLYQYAALTDNGAMTFTETERGIIDLTAAADLEDTTAAHHQLTVTNGLESFTPPVDGEGDPLDEPDGGWSPTYDFTPGRQLQVQAAGWVMTDLTSYEDSEVVTVLGDYHVIDALRGNRDAAFTVTDLLGMVGLASWDGESDLNFRGWNVAEAIAFGLEYLGIGSAQYDLEDTGLTVPDDREHCHPRGTNWLKILRALVDAGGTLYYDWSDGKVKSGCRYCRAKRTAATLLTHADNAWLSSACLAVDLLRVAGGVDLTAYVRPDEPLLPGTGEAYTMFPAADFQCEEATLDPRDFANAITVCGKYVQKTYPTGKPMKRLDGWDDVVARWRNRASLDYEYIEANPAAEPDYLGWLINHVENDDNLVTEQQVWQRVAELAARLSPRARKARFTIPLLASLKPGQVVNVRGAQAQQCHDVNFRVTGVRHNPGNSRTEVRGREMLGLPSL